MRYVNLTTAADQYQAHFIEKALEDEGIRCMVINENSSTLLPHAGYAGVVIQIRVVDVDLEAAQNVLSKLKQETDVVHCPNCDSTNVEYGLGVKNKVRNVFVIIASALFWAPVSRFHLVYSCKNCGTEFRKSKF